MICNMSTTEYLKKLEFWNQRALTSEHPGSDDYVAKELEQKFIINNIPVKSRVLDIGCGDGSTIHRLHQEKQVTGIGIDYSKEMINKAIYRQMNSDILFINKSMFLVSNEDLGQFNVVYTQRCLINLDSFEEQKKAINRIKGLLKPNGIFIMVEATLDGLEQTNKLRQTLGLNVILPPWHNLYFNINDVSTLQTDDFFIEKIEEVSSTYYFISRVIYAKQVTVQCEEPSYDSEINLLSAQLPQSICNCGPVKGLIWRKKGV